MFLDDHVEKFEGKLLGFVDLRLAELLASCYFSIKMCVFLQFVLLVYYLLFVSVCSHAPDGSWGEGH